MSRLEGLGIVITRPRPEAEALAAELAARGARPIVFPALAIEEVPASPALEAALAGLPRAALAIFVSANAVARGLAEVRRRGEWPAGVAVAAVGEATAAALRARGFAEVVFPRERQDSEGLAELAQLQADRLSGENVVVFRGEGGRERLRELLEARGAKVVYAECYRRVRPAGDPAPLLAAWGRGEVQAVSALSAETLHNFVAMIGAEGARHLAATTLVVPHEAVARRPEARRFAQVRIAAPGAEAIAAALSPKRVSP